MTSQTISRLQAGRRTPRRRGTRLRGLRDDAMAFADRLARSIRTSHQITEGTDR